MFNHTINFNNLHSSMELWNFVSTNHCQDGTNKLVYKLESCNDCMDEAPEGGKRINSKKLRHLKNQFNINPESIQFQSGINLASFKPKQNCKKSHDTVPLISVQDSGKLD